MPTFDCSSVSLSQLLLHLWRYAKVQDTITAAETQYEAPIDPPEIEIDWFVKHEDSDYFWGCYIGVSFVDPKAISSTKYDKEYGDGAFEKILSALK